MANVPLYITYAQIAQYEEESKNRKDRLFKGGVLVPPYSRLLYILQTQIAKRYALNPTDSTLNATAEYMFSLTGARTINTTPVATPFIIIIHPQSQTVTAGTSVTFSVTAAGGTIPYAYQWQKNGVNIGGETNQSITINPTTLGSAGTYDCVVTDAKGQVIQSNNANLVVNAAAITGSYYYGDTDYFTALSGGTDTVPYQGTFPITHNAPLVPPYPLAAGNNKQLVIRVSVGESLKSNWFNTAFNFGTIQPSDGIFRIPLNPAGLPLYTYYLTELASSFDFNSPNVLTLS